MTAGMKRRTFKNVCVCQLKVSGAAERRRTELEAVGAAVTVEVGKGPPHEALDGLLVKALGVWPGRCCCRRGVRSGCGAGAGAGAGRRLLLLLLLLLLRRCGCCSSCSGGGSCYVRALGPGSLAWRVGSRWRWPVLGRRLLRRRGWLGGGLWRSTASSRLSHYGMIRGEKRMSSCRGS